MLKGHWTTCPVCRGQGKLRKKIRKKARLRYQRELNHFVEAGHEGVRPVRPRGHLDACASCNGTGLLSSPSDSPSNDQYPHVAIVGGGIGGAALAVACLHRGLPFTLYERDLRFNERSQGYGLTLQQASSAIKGLGITSLKGGLVSTRHVVHNAVGRVIANWGMRNLPESKVPTSPKRTNIHITRQSLRLALLEQLGDQDRVRWGHRLVGFQERGANGLDLRFHVAGATKTARADLLVGADGIRSTVRRTMMGEDVSPLSYLGCIVILGICPLDRIEGVDRTLLDSATVFQTANGHERMYMMPFDHDSIMWQFSCPLPEEEARALSAAGAAALKAEAQRRCPWHAPIPQVLTATQEAEITGYPVYDRALLEPGMLANAGAVTLIGDAAHPMSPFKGQGANQALLDALALARAINRWGGSTRWTEVGMREAVLTEFEAGMMERTAAKVTASAEAARFLHSEVVLHEADEPRGRCLKTGQTP
jgi:2-polyprenyl-6-methoxyphenol hydroxylase-like FAD-dependent oxidoreductase